MKKSYSLILIFTISFFLLSSCASPRTPSESSPFSSATSSASFSPSSSQTVSDSHLTSSSTSALNPLLEAFNDIENWDGTHPKGLSRNWSDLFMNGGGTNTRYIFSEDSTFYYAAGSDTLNRVRYLDGSWIYDQGSSTITLTVNKKIVIENGEVFQGGGSMPRIVNGILKKYTLQSPETIILQLNKDRTTFEYDKAGESNSSGIIAINNTPFYAVSSVGYDDIPEYWNTHDYYNLPTMNETI